MKTMLRALLGIALVCVMETSAYSQQSSEAPLTNGAVIKLVKAGFKEKTIIAIINSRPNRFKLETEQLIELKHNGVSENVILAMLSLAGLNVEQVDEWEDDASFFRRSTQQARDSQQNNQQGESTNIFGSGSGSKSKTESRGGQGGNESEGNVSGSATVRIIRPGESSGEPAKLERTPTLNNEAVIRLVEAGFSEGTIIKRIEDSPVEFDLSPNKLQELHKRRVTDSIIAAMTTAMSDGPAKPELEKKN